MPVLYHIHKLRRYILLIIPVVLIGINSSFLVPGSGEKIPSSDISNLDQWIEFAGSIRLENDLFKPKPVSLDEYAWNSLEIRSLKKSSNSVYPVMGRGSYTSDRMAAFLKQHNERLSLNEAIEFARLYREECRKEGVNHDLAFAQMCLETGYLKYGGVVKAEQNNFCGLGALNNYVQGDFFPDRRTGIKAHIQHLKAYGSKDSLKTRLVDKRFDHVKRGSAPNLAQLTGKWATDRHYDKKIKGILKRISNYDLTLKLNSSNELLILNYE